MLRHEFQPGKLVAGVFLLAAGVAYLGDAGGAWETPWYAIIPIVAVGLFLAAVTTGTTYAVRRSRRNTTGPRTLDGPPPAP
ncbi:hypothetical protein [Streptomyces himalayensis]|uniref:Uncharacterized protein n=1 Tax=Streptomyces himalayensis subsp. himalayensis TaxID=2756131 RepID=A0A7W0DN87_9ACTN|nr:hypothetical protein [Streptomyces himalayensis]MBA2948203.1 hypothetical protein [Streptomyces himalayensis subsp. himalayensis]